MKICTSDTELDDKPRESNECPDVAHKQIVFWCDHPFSADHSMLPVFEEYLHYAGLSRDGATELANLVNVVSKTLYRLGC